MKNINRNIKIVAKSHVYDDGFGIYLDFSGQHELLMQHRHNGVLYGMLKDGVSIADVIRWNMTRGKDGHGFTRLNRPYYSMKLGQSVQYILSLAERYIQERELYLEFMAAA